MHKCGSRFFPVVVGNMHINVTSVNMNMVSGCESGKVGSWVPKGYKYMPSPEQ